MMTKKGSALLQLLGVAAALDGGQLMKALVDGKIIDENIILGPRQGDQTRRFFRALKNKDFEKIDPAYAFISAGFDYNTKLYHAAVMRPNPIRGEAPEYIVAAKRQDGFALSESAKMDAAKEFPLVPVLMDKILTSDPDRFTYPYYTERMEKKRRLVDAANLKRERQAQKRQENAEKSEAGRHKELTIRPKKKKRRNKK